MTLHLEKHIYTYSKMREISWHIVDSELQKPLQWVELRDIERALNHGELNADKVITMRELHACGVTPLVQYGLAIVNNSSSLHTLKHRVHIEVTFVTPKAKEAIENAGGIVRLRYYTEHNLRRLQQPWKYEFVGSPQQLQSLPRPRLRHMFPDYPQLPAPSKIERLGKYQVHPTLLPRHVGESEKQEQERKMALYYHKAPKPKWMQQSGIKDKLFRWSKHTWRTIENLHLTNHTETQFLI